jgi:transposase
MCKWEQDEEGGAREQNKGKGEEGEAQKEKMERKRSVPKHRQGWETCILPHTDV